MTNAASTGTSPRRDPDRRRDGGDVASWPRLSAVTASRPRPKRRHGRSSVRVLDLPPRPPAIGDAKDHEDGATVRARALTGLALVAMGGLLMLAAGRTFLGH